MFPKCQASPALRRIMTSYRASRWTPAADGGAVIERLDDAYGMNRTRYLVSRAAIAAEAAEAAESR